MRANILTGGNLSISGARDVTIVLGMKPTFRLETEKAFFRQRSLRFYPGKVSAYKLNDRGNFTLTLGS